MSIKDLSLDAWCELGKILHFRYIVRLYLCGDVKINYIITQQRVVTDAIMIFRGSEPNVGWTPILSKFSHIRRFVYNMSGMSGNAYYFPTKHDLVTLGPSLEHLELCVDGAEHAFFETEKWDGNFEGVSKTLGEPLQIRDTWPNLISLRISQFSSYKRKLASLDRAMETLPACLRHFKISYSTDFPIKYLKSLPRDLEYLDITSGSFSTDGFCDLPKLVSFYAHINISGSHKEYNVENWGHLPPTLTSLKIYTPPNHRLAEIIPLLPKQIIHLDFGSATDVSHLPLLTAHLSSLQALRIIFEYKTETTDGLKKVRAELPEVARSIKYLQCDIHNPFITWDDKKSEWCEANVSEFPWESPYINT